LGKEGQSLSQGDEIRQASAVIAAVREVALMLIEQHLEIGAGVAAASPAEARC
jgi:hypothetical protein